MSTPEEPQAWSQNELPPNLSPHLRKLTEDVLQAAKDGSFDNAWGAFDNAWNEHASTFEMPPIVTERTERWRWEQSSSRWDKTSSQSSQSTSWAHWEYSPQAWKRFDQLDWGSAKRRFFVFLVVSPLMFAFITSLFLKFFVSAFVPIDLIDPTDFLVFIPVFMPLVMLLGFTIGFGAATRGRDFRQARQRHIARLSGPNRVTIGNVTGRNQAIWQAGLYVELQTYRIFLKRVTLTTNPAVLKLHRKHTGYKQMSWHDTIHVPVPYGREAEARQLVERFREETIGAQKRQQPSTPAEPQ